MTEQVKPVAYAVIVDGAWHGVCKHEIDAQHAGFETERRFDILPLFFEAPAHPTRDEVIEECRRLIYLIGIDWLKAGDTRKSDACDYLDSMFEDLKSQPAKPDPRDEALRIAREALEELHYSKTTVAERKYNAALSAIEAALKGVG